MRVRADIVALIHLGHTNEHIAHRLGCHRNTVSATRVALNRALANPTAVERLYAEALPTGQVRDYRPARMPTSEAQAAANRARLLAALRGDVESEAA